MAEFDRNRLGQPPSSSPSPVAEPAEEFLHSRKPLNQAAFPGRQRAELSGAPIRPPISCPASWSGGSLRYARSRRRPKLHGPSSNWQLTPGKGSPRRRDRLPQAKISLSAPPSRTSAPEELCDAGLLQSDAAITRLRCELEGQVPIWREGNGLVVLLRNVVGSNASGL